jgi:deoxyribonuclease-4
VDRAPRIGAHVPTRGGLFGAVDSAHACSAEAAQIWGSNPRAWAEPTVAEERREAFRRAWAEASIGPLFLHAPYVVNVASPNPEFRARSISLARATARLADVIGAAGGVVHAGSAGAGRVRARAVHLAAGSLRSIAEEADETRVLVELTAGGTGSVASTFPQARELFDAADHPRLALCVDTCHLFATGYHLDSPEGVLRTFAALRRAGLAAKLRLVHANDSKFARGLRRDSHTHIGQGHIGEVGFRAILAQPAVRRCVVVCETPGRLEATARNVSTLRRLALLDS